MIRRITALIGASLVICTAGCALLPVLALPFELLFSVLGGIGKGLGKGLDAIVQVEPVEGPEPYPEWRILPNGDRGIALRGVEAESRFRVRFDVPGYQPLELAWPEDFPDAQLVGGQLHVPLQLELLAQTTTESLR